MESRLQREGPIGLQGASVHDRLLKIRNRPKKPASEKTG